MFKELFELCSFQFWRSSCRRSLSSMPFALSSWPSLVPRLFGGTFFRRKAQLKRRSATLGLSTGFLAILSPLLVSFFGEFQSADPADLGHRVISKLKSRHRHDDSGTTTQVVALLLPAPRYVVSGVFSFFIHHQIKSARKTKGSFYSLFFRNSLKSDSVTLPMKSSLEIWSVTCSLFSTMSQ
jgi:hypothetical protein